MSLDQDATVDIEASEHPVSMEDTIRETIREITSRDVDTESVDSPEDSPTIDTKAPSRARDESGKFAKSTTKSLSGVSPDNVATEEVAQENTQAEAVTTRVAPNTWKKQAQEAFIKADPIIQAEVERREADFHRGIDQYKQAAEWAHKVDQAISPYKQTFEKLGIAPDVAIASLAGADHKLRYGSPQEKAEYFSYLAKVYGIDLGHTAHVAQTVDPRIYQLQEENQRLQQTFQYQQQVAQQQEYDSLNSEISTFAADPKHEHFETVRGHMVALLQANQAKDLNDAYEQAIYANPVTRSAVIQQQATAQRAEASKKAQEARAASSVNLRSRPAFETTETLGSMEDTIRRLYRSSQGQI